MPPVEWLAYDSSHLLRRSSVPKGDLHILADVGTADKFLKDGQLEPDTLKAAAEERQEGEVTVRIQDGYDHSYFFVSILSRSRSAGLGLTFGFRPLLQSTSSGTPSFSRRRTRDSDPRLRHERKLCKRMSILAERYTT